MNENIESFLRDIADLDEEKQNSRVKDYIEMQIENFILFWTSDDKERKDMLESLKTYMKEEFE